ncbi:hypothetical protein [Sorangium sp. So ce513]|uniref:hypothetical protein n=1 Tax=Sorangium sp. So ce513 TaxID=3133315 RepID=UPI003F5E936C
MILFMGERDPLTRARHRTAAEGRATRSPGDRLSLLERPADRRRHLCRGAGPLGQPPWSEHPAGDAEAFASLRRGSLAWESRGRAIPVMRRRI